MAIDPKELTKEQKEKLEKLYRKYLGKIALSILLYLIFLFFSNFFIIVITMIKNIDSSIKFFLFLANATIAFGGLRGTIDEKREDLIIEVQRIVGHL